MLFLLTGDVQIGKTRWLERVVVELERDGADVAGVLAPGVWRAEEGRLEKLGIDNVLLPGGERVAFARRRDLALAEGTFDPASQSAAAQLAWHISDDAIAQVNAHFDRLAQDTRMFHVKHPFVQTDVSRETSGCALGEVLGRGLLVVDELGRLELERDGGLTSATALLAAGPTGRFAHALVVVRNWLRPCARERFAAVWGGAEELAPGDEARASVRSTLGLPGGRRSAFDSSAALAFLNEN